MRPKFRATYGVDIYGELSPYARARLDEEFQGDFMRFPVERMFLSEAARVGVGTYAPHDPTTADIADFVGSVDLSKVADIGDEGDPRAWSWSGAVYAASRGVLEMIEILKVKREFLYLLLTLTQEKNVKVSRFPLIHLDETILAHTNLAEFNKFLQEKENEALLDRMVIVQGAVHALVPRRGPHLPQARVERAGIPQGALRSARARSRLRVFDSHAAAKAATRRPRSHEETEAVRRARTSRASPRPTCRASTPESTDEGLTGVSPRFVINAICNAITRNNVASLTSMDMLLALKDSIETDARMDAGRKKQWIEFLVLARKDFYNRWVKEDVHRALFASFQEEAQQLLEKYLDEVEASLDKREVEDPITGESRPPDERFLRSVEEKIKISESGKLSFRQEVVRKAMVAFKTGEKFTLDNHSRLHEAIEQYLFEERRDVLRLVTSRARPDEEAEQKISAVQERLIREYGYDEHSAKEALELRHDVAVSGVAQDRGKGGREQHGRVVRVHRSFRFRAAVV